MLRIELIDVVGAETHRALMFLLQPSVAIDHNFDIPADHNRLLQILGLWLFVVVARSDSHLEGSV